MRHTSFGSIVDLDNTLPITQRRGDLIISAPKAAWVHGFVRLLLGMHL